MNHIRVVHRLVVVSSDTPRAVVARDQSWLHMGEDLRESLAIPSYPLVDFSEGQLLPYMVVDRLPVEVDQILLA